MCGLERKRDNRRVRFFLRFTAASSARKERLSKRSFLRQPNTTLSAFGGAPVANGGAEMCKPNAAGSCYAFDDAASTPTAAADSVQHRITEMVHPPARRLAR